MKTLFIVFLIVLTVGFSIGYAQNVVYTNQITITWNPVAPIEPTDLITYQVWIDSAATGLQMVGETELAPYTITFTVEGGYIVGVGTRRVEANTGASVYSEINWSYEDIPPGATPNPFVVNHVKGIPMPMNMRTQ